MKGKSRTICILHGYPLDGSGSNLWTGTMVRTLCRAGETVHLLCQEPHPARFDYVAQATRYDEALRPTILFSREVSYPGRCIMHQPTPGGVLPVYVWDEYEEFDRVVPMVELDAAAIEDYIARNAQVLDRVVAENGITALHANHAVLMSVVAQRVGETRNIPYSILPHGSAIEYAVKKDSRFHRLASEAFRRAGAVFVNSPELRQRVKTVFAGLPGIEEKLVNLNLGVDASLFEPLPAAARRSKIERLAEALRAVERGKTPEMTSTMRHRLAGDLSRQGLRQVLAQAADYKARCADSDCEAKLEAIDWEAEKILIFVGRLIASKGVHAVVAALPSILKQEPRVRLLVVGHGPLREPLEAMLWALETGSRTLFHNIVRWGRRLEGCPEGTPKEEPFEHVARYLERLEARGELDAYFHIARQSRVSERVIFTGYLTHRELCHLFPCCDAAIFPSIVAEAGPLVFLEAMASGVFPVGIYFGGMAASIDSAASALPADVVGLMKLRPEPRHTVADIVSRVPDILRLGRTCAEKLRRVAVERYDWKAVGQTFLSTLEGLAGL